MILKQLSSKALIKGVAGLASIAIAAFALVNFLPAGLFSSGAAKNEKTEVRNSLSGRIGSDGPILAVKIDDTAQAHPQAGLEDADIVYAQYVGGYSSGNESPSTAIARALAFSQKLDSADQELLVNAATTLSSSNVLKPNQVIVRFTFATTSKLGNP